MREARKKYTSVIGNYSSGKLAKLNRQFRQLTEIVDFLIFQEIAETFLGCETFGK